MAADNETSLGSYLRHERESRGIAIEQVASATKVGIKTLHALEADHFAELPAKPFIRGFVSSYCRFIGLNPKEVLANFDEYIDLRSVERPRRDAGHSGYAFEKKDGEQQSRTILTIAIVSFIAIGGITLLILKPSLRHHRTSHIDRLMTAYPLSETPGASPTTVPNSGVLPNAPPPVVAGGPVPLPPIPVTGPTPESASPPKVEKTVSEITAPVALPPVNPTVTPPLTKAVEAVAAKEEPEGSENDPLDSGATLKPQEIKYKLTFKILSDVWVRYRVDGRPVRKFIIRRGKTLVLRAKTKVKFQVSHPENILVNLNGEKSVPLNEWVGVKTLDGDSTLLLPEELAAHEDKSFDGEKPLSKTIPQVPDKKSTE